MNAKDIIKSRTMILVVIGGILTSIIAPIYLDARKSRESIALNSLENFRKVRTLLPENTTVTACMRREEFVSFEERLTFCSREAQRLGEDAQAVFRATTDRLEIEYGQNFSSKNTALIDSIDYAIYEIWNNEQIKAKWRFDGCSENISIVSTVPTITQKSVDGTIRCMLGIESYVDFLERNQDNTDNISVVRNNTVKREKVKSYIIPGNETTIEDYFHDSNNAQFGLISDLMSQFEVIILDEGGRVVF